MRDQVTLSELFGVKLRADDDVVDGNVNKFDKESDEAHDSESNSGSDGDLLEFWKRKKYVTIQFQIKLVKLQGQILKNVSNFAISRDIFSKKLTDCRHGV